MRSVVGSRDFRDMGQKCDGDGGATVVFVGGKASGERLVEGQKGEKKIKTRGCRQPFISVRGTDFDACLLRNTNEPLLVVVYISLCFCLPK